MVTEPFVGASLQVQIGSFSDLLFPLGVVAVLALGVLFVVVRVAMIQGTGQSEGPSPDELRRLRRPDPPRRGDCEYCGRPMSENR